MGKLAWVDLSDGRTEVTETGAYLPDYIGGRGIAARIAWDHLPPGTGPFDEQNPVIIMTGPLTGTSAPFSGRTTLCSLAPQGWPQNWYTRSSFGGHWGPALKYAGYDGIVIRGIAEKPVYLYIDGSILGIRDATSLWGKGIYETQQILMDKYGKHTRVFAIGPAGENLCRISVIATETESASGQGGFGAVLGAKNLKAIVVRGLEPIRIAEPEAFADFCRKVADEAHGSHGWPYTRPLDPELVCKYGQRYQACTQQCHAKCWDARYYTGVPGRVFDKKYSGQVDCIAGLFPGIAETFYNWKLGFEGGFEAGKFANDFGLNHWEILVGLIPWLRKCAGEGLFSDLDGVPFNLDDPHFWHAFMRKIAFREGMGEALSEGGLRAAGLLGFGREWIDDFYCAWGYAGHWDGHGDKINYIYFPFWLVSAILWATDTRDPISSTHGYVQNVMGWSKSCSPEAGLEWEEIIAVGEKAYGSPHATSPTSGYRDKAWPAIWHQHRSVLKDALPLDDQIFPRIFSKKTADHFARIGDIEGPSFEYHLFRLATGAALSEEAFLHAAERILNLERCLQVRNFGRRRGDDEGVIPYFSKPETRVNPFIKKKVGMDGGKFRKMMDEYYERRGWDPATGIPKREKLQALGLDFALPD
jgi:aldehyde:ferredoxin oxidoreductase